MVPDSGAVPNTSQSIVNKADFERLLSERSAARSAHFALHHVSGEPAKRQRTPVDSAAIRLSTGQDPEMFGSVDKLLPGRWLGCMVPKRHARRAVTRNLLKRQMRSAFHRHAPALSPGLWLLRLRAPFAVAQYPSARSTALAAAVRSELEALLLGRASRSSQAAEAGLSAVR